MKVIVSGSHGLIGTALVANLEADGHQVTRLVREGSEGARWDPMDGTIDAAALEGHDAVVHLAGAGIADRRWTDEHKRAVLESRSRGTSLLAGTVAELDRPPAVFASGSAMGFYGDRGDELLTEDSGPGSGFLADVVREWEASTEPVERAGVRVAHLRTSLVLSNEGGALKQMLLPFKLGVGGRIGSGRQWWSWIAIDDEVGAIRHVLERDVRGPVNLAAPNPVTNEAFAKTLGRVLRRPTVLPTPVTALKLAMGQEMVNEMMLAGQRVVPERLQATGYEFRYPELEGALQHVLA